MEEDSEGVEIIELVSLEGSWLLSIGGLEDTPSQATREVIRASRESVFTFFISWIAFFNSFINLFLLE